MRTIDWENVVETTPTVVDRAALTVEVLASDSLMAACPAMDTDTDVDAVELTDGPAARAVVLNTVREPA